jgi:hypothetical protein
VSGSSYLQALAIMDKRTNRPSNRTETRPCPFETCPPSHVPFTMTSVAFPKSIFSELAADLPRRACRTGESITMSSKGTWLNVGSTSFAGKIALALLFLFSATCFAATSGGGACPTGANYLNTATNTLVTLSSLGITSCYFIAANGADTNAGTTEGAPWAHAPGMANATGNPASVWSGKLPAGTGLIFRGGDTWHFGNSSASPYTGGTLNFNVSPYPMGTSTNPIYLGVDQSWYSGGSWVRPVFTADNPLCNGNTLGSNCLSGTDTFGQTYYYVNTCAYQTSGGTNNILDVSGLQYYIVDNFEMTGLCQSSVGQPNSHDTYVSYHSICNSGPCSSAAPLVLMNNYIHGASHLKYAAPNGSAGCTSSTVCINISAFWGAVVNNSVGETIQDNVVDFADSDPVGENLTLAGFYNVAYNVFRYTTQGLMGTFHLFHDNLYEYYFENGHSNLIESMDPAGTNAFYNNVFRHLETSGGGGVGIWLGPTKGATDFFFNNVMYDTGAIEYFNIGGTALTQVEGNYVIFNNTFQANVAQPILRCINYTNGTVANTNNHFIDDQSYNGCSTMTTTTPLAQTNAQADANVSAHFDQYSASEPQGYSPVASTNSTVIAGTNGYNSMCGALGTAGLAAAQTACESSVTYACSYAGNGAAPVCPAGTVNSRPSNTAWDVGAYEFNAQNPPPNPPTGLTAIVN